MKIFLASFGSYLRCKGFADLGGQFFLESFVYVKEEDMEFFKKQEFLLDSGAFTFMNLNKTHNIDWEDFIEKYASFINKFDIQYFFELDIDSIVGYKEVVRLRGILEEKTGKKCIPVWHKSRGLEEYIKLTKDYNYIAIGGIVTKEITKKEYPIFTKLLKIARDSNCKVHGLGFTGIENLKKYPFYSVDSTSWLSGGRFGTIYNFDNGNLYVVKKPNTDKRISDYIKLNTHNYKVWIKIQDYFLQR